MVMRSIENNAEAIVIEKKSKFIANIFYVESVREAEEIIEKTRKKYYDARHNCYAYRIMQEDNLIEKQSDDGEPSGTAGVPMLNILSKKELVNVIVIVTRYFGGILLGTGGLVRAYSEATKKALENTNEIEIEKGYIVEAIVEYEMQKKFEYACEKRKINIISKEYAEKIKNIIEISKNTYVEFCQKMADENLNGILIKIEENKYIKTLKNQRK